jgi:hypothetical protein
MMGTRAAAHVAVVALLLFPSWAWCQSAGSPQTPGGAPQAAADGTAARNWTFSASVFGYFPADASDYAQPSVTADHDRLHLEARYNYEALRTASAWVGYNFSGGRTLTWEFTPMVGGVFGDVAGAAPGFKASLAWKKLEFSSEGEYVFDTADSSQSFFYNWSELSLAPVDWLRAGLVTQRTRAYQSDRDIQRGLLLGVAIRSIDVTAYVLNPDDNRPTVVVAVAVRF